MKSSQPVQSKRCKKCFYILDHLECQTCPECGRIFDLNDPETYTVKSPFMWWTFWLPAFSLASIGGGLLWAALILSYGYTAATTITVPLVIGTLVSYGAKVRGPFQMFLASVAVFIAILLVAGLGFAGGFCGLILGVLAIIPMLVGMLAGWLLRIALANSRFSQRDYLRSILLLLLLVLFPTLAASIEGRHPQSMPVVVTTSQIVNAPPNQAWHGIQFFEEVRRPVPWLLWVSPSLRPLYTVGHSEKVGDLKTCIYRRGKLIKQVTQIIPGKRLAFRVIDQDRIETDGAKLLDGSFDLQSVDGGKRTRVLLTTRYIPLLNPRFAYQWAESWAIHTLHGHVLAGMRDTAEGTVQ